MVDPRLLNESLLKLSNRAVKKKSDDINHQLELLKQKHKEKKAVTVSDFNKVISSFYRVSPDSITDNVPSMFKVIRFALFAGLPALIHPALGLAGWLVDKVIEEKMNENTEAKVLKVYRKELEKVKKDLENPNLSEEERETLKATKRVYQDNVEKLERYYQGLKMYHDRPVIGEKHEDKEDDEFDFSFNENMLQVNGGVHMIYSDEEMVKRMIQQYNEAFDQVILLCLENGQTFSEAGDVRHAAKVAYSKAERMDRKSSRAIDSVADTVRDGGKKNEVKKIREDILNGRIKASTIIKTGFAYALVHLTFGPHIALISAAIWLVRKGLVKNHQKQEMLAELKSELEILNEKIKDAESDNDKKKKYQYLRLRREVQRNIDRIRFNNTLKDMDHGM
jgi:hypothetical protein